MGALGQHWGCSVLGGERLREVVTAEGVTLPSTFPLGLLSPTPPSFFLLGQLLECLCPALPRPCAGPGMVETLAKLELNWARAKCLLQDLHLLPLALLMVQAGALALDG